MPKAVSSPRQALPHTDGAGSNGVNPLPSHLLTDILDALPEPVYVKDRRHRWVSVNEAFCEYMGRERAELLGKTEADFLPEQEAAVAWESDETVFKTGQTVVNESVPDTEDGCARLLQTEKTLLHEPGNKQLLLGVIRDLSGTDAARILLTGNTVERSRRRTRRTKGSVRRLGEQTVRFAFSDPLTQLPNRRAFMNLLDAAAARVSQRAAVFVINIDHFKLVNDRFGHLAGDTLILEVASRLREAIGKDDLLGRLDNDEFIILADDIDSMDADRVVEKLLANIGQPLQLNRHEYRISVSVGIAMFPEHGRSAEDLVRNASMAMRWCKRRSRGGSEYYSDGADAAADRMASIEIKLPLALEQNKLLMYYQPIIRGSDRMVSGFEALARWRDPELGDLAPTEFIPIAENMGLIRKLGETILDQACAFTASLKDTRMSVSVNVSGSQLLDETFPIFVAESLQKHKITGDRIFFEITETVAMEADASVWRVFEELTSLGVRLIIDDFGTGFSNLARLKELPFVAIKIDREFVRDLPNSPQDRAIFRATHAIAKELNLKIVAEGVDDLEKEEFVRNLGVDYVQGHRFGHPVPAARLARYTT